MQLIYQLLNGGAALTAPSFIERLPLIGEAFATAMEIPIQGHRRDVTTNSATGKSRGIRRLVEPIENGGSSMAFCERPSGCTAERVFRGPMGRSLYLQGAEMIRDCPERPLSFNAVTMTQSNSPPPPPSAKHDYYVDCAVHVLRIAGHGFGPGHCNDVSGYGHRVRPTVTWIAEVGDDLPHRQHADRSGNRDGAVHGSPRIQRACSVGDAARGWAGRTVNQGAPPLPADLVPFSRKAIARFPRPMSDLLLSAPETPAQEQRVSRRLQGSCSTRWSGARSG